MDRKQSTHGVPLLVFAKAPVAGFTKTRLIRVLGAEGAARLQGELVRHTLRTCVSAATGPVALWCTPVADHPFFEQCARDFAVTLHRQQGDDLGERMHGALWSALRENRAAVLLGTDSPGLTSDDLRSAAHALDEDAQAVIAPAHDGGYVLIGLTRVEKALFAGIEWGSGQVLEQTRQRLREHHYRWRELRTQRDIDRPEDWLGLIAASPDWLERVAPPAL